MSPCGGLCSATDRSLSSCHCCLSRPPSHQLPPHSFCTVHPCSSHHAVCTIHRFYAPRFSLHAQCTMHHAPRCLHHATCTTQFAPCSMHPQHAPRFMLHASLCIRRCCTLHALRTLHAPRTHFVWGAVKAARPLLMYACTFVDNAHCRALLRFALFDFASPEEFHVGFMVSDNVRHCEHPCLGFSSSCRRFPLLKRLLRRFLLLLRRSALSPPSVSAVFTYRSFAGAFVLPSMSLPALTTISAPHAYSPATDALCCGALRFSPWLDAPGVHTVGATRYGAMG